MGSPIFQPLYQQIKALITQSLISGEWGPERLFQVKWNWLHDTG